MSYTEFVHSSNTAAAHIAVLVCSNACGADKFYVHAVQWYVCQIYAAIIGMLFKAKNELKQHLVSINPIYAK